MLVVCYNAKNDKRDIYKNLEEAFDALSKLEWTNFNAGRVVKDIIATGRSIVKCPNDTDIHVRINLQEGDKIAFFIDGPDNTGKSTAIADALSMYNAYHMAEFGSGQSDVKYSNMFKTYALSFEALHHSRMMAHMTFANRYYNFEHYFEAKLHDWVDDNDILIVDRSWLTAFAYQGRDDINYRAELFVMGLDFDRWLLKRNILPVKMVLKNTPFEDKNDEPIEAYSKGSFERFSEAHHMLVDNGQLSMLIDNTDVAQKINDVYRSIKGESLNLETPAHIGAYCRESRMSKILKTLGFRK